MPDNQRLTLFSMTERAMSAQLVRMNAAASNLANAGSVAAREGDAYRPLRAVFTSELDRASGLATVRSDGLVRETTAPTKRYDPGHPLADQDGNVFEAPVDESAEMVEIMESARQYQNLVQALTTAKQLMLENLEEQLIMQSNATISTPPGLQDTLDRLNAPSTIQRQSAAASLDSADFLRLMTAQLANQDPLEPQSNEQMLAQLAQFSSLEAQTSSEATLADISAKLDALIAAQEAAAEASRAAAEAAARAADAARTDGPSEADKAEAENEFSALT